MDAQEIETTYAACLLECGPPHIHFQEYPMEATVGDVTKAREWWKRNRIARGWTGGYYQGFCPWWVGYKEWFVENRRGN